MMAKKSLSKKKANPVLALVFVGLIVIIGIVIIFISRAANPATDPLHACYPDAFCDPNNKPVLLNGTNIRFVGQQTSYTSSTQMQKIKNKGFNAVRFALRWNLYQPSAGPTGFDATAFNNLRTAVNNAKAAGIYVILDPIHFAGDGTSCSSLSGCIPTWAAPTTGSPVERIQANAKDYIQKIASDYANEPAVAAIDLANEVRPANYDDDLAVIKMYSTLAEQARAVAPNKTLMIESTTGDKLFSANALANLTVKDNMVFSYHDYFGGAYNSSGALISGCNPNGYTASGSVCGNATYENKQGYPYIDKTKLESHIKANLDMLADSRIRLPLFVGEYGIAEGLVNPVQWRKDFVDVLNKYNVSRTYWQYFNSYTDLPAENLAMIDCGGSAGTSGCNIDLQTWKSWVGDVTVVPSPTQDIYPPSVPSLSAAYSQPSNSALLSWSVSTDNVGVSGYEVWRSVGTGTFSKIADVTTTTYTNSALSAGTTYNYYVKAKDAAGNISAQSNIATITTSSPDTPPSVSITNPIDGTKLISATTITSSVTDDKGVTKVEYFVDGASVGAVLLAPYSFNLDISKYTNGNHTIYARATDTIGQTGDSATITVNIQNPDTVAPTAPTNLVATASAYNKVDLSWTSSTDNVGVTSYYVVRDGAMIVQLSGSVTSFSDTNTTASTQYSYYVFAQDATGNISPNSNTQTVSTPAVPDTIAPSAPSSLAAQVVSSSQINLNWTASTDNIAVATYDIYRGSNKVASVTGTSFGDTGLSAGSTYSYYVVAIDPSNNKSANSNIASATIPAQVTSGTLNGQVTRSTNGNPVGQAYVTILDLNGTKIFQTRTNSNGYYSITPIPQGTYNVRFAKSNLSTLLLVQNIQAGITHILNVIMAPR